MPPTLYIQLDNTYKDNKNCIVFTFLALLVKLGVFTEVYVYSVEYSDATLIIFVISQIEIHFHRVGHTHEDIDMLFSHYSAKLCKENIWHIDDLIRLFSKVADAFSFPNHTPHVARIDQVLDFKFWLNAPHMFNIGKFHSFRLSMYHKNGQEDGSVLLQVKRWAYGKEWNDCGGLEDPDAKPIRIFTKVCFLF